MFEICHQNYQLCEKMSIKKKCYKKKTIYSSTL